LQKPNFTDTSELFGNGRLAADKEFQNHGIGSGLLRDALRRMVQAAAMVGVTALVDHALDDDALAFYIKYGFVAFSSGISDLVHASSNNRGCPLTSGV